MQRVLGILNRAGVIPPSPTNAPITIEYDSIFSNAQKAAGIGNVERFMAAVGQVLPIAPEVNHVLDWRELVYEYGDRLNIPARTVRTREEVEARLQQERELAQANQEAEIAAKVGQAAGALANAAPAGVAQDSPPSRRTLSRMVCAQHSPPWRDVASYGACSSGRTSSRIAGARPMRQPTSPLGSRTSGSSCLAYLKRRTRKRG